MNAFIHTNEDARDAHVAMSRFNRIGALHEHHVGACSHVALRAIDRGLDALDAQRTLYGAQQTLQQVRLTRLQNLVTLYKALGGGLAEHSTPPQSAAGSAS